MRMRILRLKTLSETGFTNINLVTILLCRMVFFHLKILCPCIDFVHIHVSIAWLHNILSNLITLIVTSCLVFG